MISVFRMGAGDGRYVLKELTGRAPTSQEAFRYYSKSFSTSSGRSWSAPEAMTGVGCAFPQLLSTGAAGPLLLGGGRMRNANTSDILLWVSAAGDGARWSAHSISSQHNRFMPPEKRFDSSVNKSGAYPTFGDPRETSSYTSLLRVGDSSAIIFYDRRRGPPSYGSDGSVVYAMRVDFERE